MGLGILASLLLAEGVLRLLPAPDVRRTGDGGEPRGELWVDPDWRLPPPRAFRLDPILLFDHERWFETPVRIAEHRGGQFTFRTNGYGLRRDDEISVAKPDGAYRVLVLGDSQTDGLVDNDETYAARLEEALKARGRQVEVLNAGVTGYAPQQEYLWYRERGAQLAPDLVVLGFYVGNDMLDLLAGRLDARVVDDDVGLIGPLSAPAAWFSLHTRLAATLQHALAHERVQAALGSVGLEREPLVDQGQLLKLLRDCHGCWLQTGKQAVTARRDSQETERAYARLGLLIRGLARRVSADGGQLVVLGIPTKHQVEPRDERGNVAKMARLLDLAEDDLIYDDVVRARLLDVAAAANVHVIDPLDELRAEAGAARLYYRRDWHLNPAGNAALARILERHLIERTPVPR